MTKIPKEPLMFAAGVAIGSVVTWLAVKKKYADMAQEEIDTVKDIYAKINQEAIDKAAAAKNKPDIMLYTQAVINEPEEPEEDDYEEEPVMEKVMYEIEPGEFASFDNYNTKVSILYFDDNVFTDERYDKIDPRDYFSKRTVLLEGGTVDTIDYIHRMTTDEICIRDTELGLDIDVYTQGRYYSDFMST